MARYSARSKDSRREASLRSRFALVGVLTISVVSALKGWYDQVRTVQDVAEHVPFGIDILQHIGRLEIELVFVAIYVGGCLGVASIGMSYGLKFVMPLVGVHCNLVCRVTIVALVCAMGLAWSERFVKHPIAETFVSFALLSGVGILVIRWWGGDLEQSEDEWVRPFSATIAQALLWYILGDAFGGLSHTEFQRAQVPYAPDDPVTAMAVMGAITIALPISYGIRRFASSLKTIVN